MPSWGSLFLPSWFSGTSPSYKVGPPLPSSQESPWYCVTTITWSLCQDVKCCITGKHPIWSLLLSSVTYFYVGPACSGVTPSHILWPWQYMFAWSYSSFNTQSVSGFSKQDWHFFSHAQLRVHPNMDWWPAGKMERYSHERKYYVVKYLLHCRLLRSFKQGRFLSFKKEGWTTSSGSNIQENLDISVLTYICPDTSFPSLRVLLFLYPMTFSLDIYLGWWFRPLWNSLILAI